MTSDDHYTFDREDVPGELVERLRRLRWPEATPEARRRCWELLSHEVARLADEGVEGMAVVDAEAGAAGASAAPGAEGADEPAVTPGDQLHERRLRRHEFAGWGFAGGERYSGALGQRVALARRATRAGAL